ncbi:MAG: CCC motif membrane protein [Bacteroidota bacterium]
MEENKFSNQPPQYGQPPVNPTNTQFGQSPVPNSTAVLVLGILSIVLCFCYGIIGIVLGIIAVVLGSKGIALYKANPNGYSLASYNNIKAGRICGIIGLILSVLYTGVYPARIASIYIVILGAAFASMPWDMMGR